MANVANIVNIEFFAWRGLSLLEPLIKQKGSMYVILWKFLDHERPHNGIFCIFFLIQSHFLHICHNAFMLHHLHIYKHCAMEESNTQIWTMVFCYQNCSDLLWEKIVVVIKKNFWNSRLKAKNLQNFWDH